MGTRLRVVLPSVMAVISVPLVAWDTHNARVIESMGMAWDMGAPVWPYQASDILLRLLNAPVYAIAMPIANLLRLAAPMHFVLIVPAILAWWWFLGLMFDRGIVRCQLFGMFGVALALLFWSTTAIHSLLLLRIGAVSPGALTSL